MENTSNTAYGQWQKLIEKDFKVDHWQEKYNNRNQWPVPVQAIYFSEHLNNYDYIEANGESLQSQNSVSQEYAYLDPKLFNALLLNDLNNGVNEIVLHFSYTKKEDYFVAFESIYLNMLRIHLRDCQNFSVFLEALNEICEKQNISKQDLQLLIYQPAYVLIDSKNSASSIKALLSLKKQYSKSKFLVFKFDSQNFSCIDYNIELKYLALCLKSFIDNCKANSISFSELQDLIFFELELDTDFFKSIAKVRSFRNLFWNLCENTAWNPYIHCRFAPSYLSKNDIWTNVLRISTACSASQIANTHSFSSWSFEASLGYVTDLGLKIQRNIQHIVQLESHLHEVYDSSHGSYYLENLSDQFSLNTWNYLIESNNKKFHECAQELQNELKNIESLNLNKVLQNKLCRIGSNEYINKNINYFDSAKTVFSVQKFKAIDDEFYSFQNMKHNIQVTILSFGDFKDYSARYNFCENFMLSIGFPIGESKNFETLPEHIISENTLVVICASDKYYEDQLEKILMMSGLSSKYIIIAGKLPANLQEKKYSLWQENISMFSNRKEIHTQIINNYKKT